jgi:hypothetical protein
VEGTSSPIQHAQHATAYAVLPSSVMPEDITSRQRPTCLRIYRNDGTTWLSQGRQYGYDSLPDNELCFAHVLTIRNDEMSSRDPVNAMWTPRLAGIFVIIVGGSRPRYLRACYAF